MDFASQVGKLLLAGALGSIIGAERELGGKAAGLRTNVVICVASALFTILSIDAFPTIGDAPRDTARVAAQIVTGVGFLGAGALIRDSSGVKGLTTAAEIWLMAAIGMAVGAGAYAAAVFTTIFIAALLFGLRPVSAWLASKSSAPPRRGPEEAHRDDGSSDGRPDRR
jgi:putative Mg2+ transporter-C (MgtC) family protein